MQLFGRVAVSQFWAVRVGFIFKPSYVFCTLVAHVASFHQTLTQILECIYCFSPILSLLFYSPLPSTTTSIPIILIFLLAPHFLLRVYLTYSTLSLFSPHSNHPLFSLRLFIILLLSPSLSQFASCSFLPSTPTTSIDSCQGPSDRSRDAVSCSQAPQWMWTKCWPMPATSAATSICWCSCSPSSISCQLSTISASFSSSYNPSIGVACPSWPTCLARTCVGYGRLRKTDRVHVTTPTSLRSAWSTERPTGAMGTGRCGLATPAGSTTWRTATGASSARWIIFANVSFISLLFHF